MEKHGSKAAALQILLRDMSVLQALQAGWRELMRKGELYGRREENDKPASG